MAAVFSCSNIVTASAPYGEWVLQTKDPEGVHDEHEHHLFELMYGITSQ